MKYMRNCVNGKNLFIIRYRILNTFLRSFRFCVNLICLAQLRRFFPSDWEQRAVVVDGLPFERSSRIESVAVHVGERTCTLLNSSAERETHASTFLADGQREVQSADEEGVVT